MGYRGARAGSGLQLKAAADAIPDNGLRVATSCSFDEVGTVSSARGRQKANDADGTGSTASRINGADDVLGGFDGFGGASISTQKKYRFIKAAANVYTNTTTSTALDDSTNLTAKYETKIPTSSALTTPASTAGTLVNPIKGLAAPTWSATSLLSGFTYGGYAYLADGTATQRLALTTGAPPTAAPGTWGVRSPGYHELTVASVLSCNNSTTMTVTVSGGHGLGFGVVTENGTPLYDGSAPYLQNIELFGLSSIGSIPDSEINCLHFGGSLGVTDIAVTSSGTTLDAGATYTLTFQNNLGARGMPPMAILSPTGGLSGLTGGSLTVGNTTQGDDDPPTNEVQTFVYTGTVTAGYFRIKVSNHMGTNETTGNIAYNATAAQVQAALEALAMVSGSTQVTSQCTVTSATAFTFVTNTTATGGAVSGGGTIGFMRQGPTLTAAANLGGMIGGTYYYAYTFYNGVAESNFSAQVPVAASTGDKITLSNILAGPIGTTERRIYRTDVNGRQLYYLGKIENNTHQTAYVDIAKVGAGGDSFVDPGVTANYQQNPAGDDDKLSKGKKASKRSIREAEIVAKAAAEKQREKLATNLGIISDWTDHDPAPSGLKHVGLIGDTAFGIDADGNLRFSKAGEVEHWPLSNSVKPPRGVSDSVLAWLPFDRDCIIYTTNGMYRLSATGLSFEDSRFEEIETPVGLVGEWALAQLDGQQGHLFLAKSGLYLFDGARVTEVSFPIETLFTDSTATGYIQPGTMSQAIMVTSRDRMLLAYRTTTAAGANDRLMWADFQDPSNPAFTVIPWGFGSMWRERADNYVLAGNADGYLYVLDNGYTDDGAAIAWAVTSKEFRFNGQTMTALDEVVLDADFAGATTAVVVTTRGRGSTKTATYSSTASGRQRVVFKLPVFLKGETAQIAVSSSHAGKRSLHEWGFTSKAFQDEP